MFGAIGGVLGNIFGTKKAIGDLVDKDNGLLVQAGGWLGGLQYTDQEKAQADAGTREWGIRALDALAPFKVVQRIGFFVVSFLLVFMAINLVVCKYIDEFTKTRSIVDGIQVVVDGTNLFEGMFQLATSQFIFWPIAIVYALFYAGGVMPRKGGS
jgi:hypothetical protein